MKLKTLAAATMLAVTASASQATTLQLPYVNEMSAGLYHDYYVYSLDLLDQCAAAGDPRCLPSGPYPVASSPGQIDDQAVVLTGSDGTQMNNITSPFPTGTAVDNPFLTPSGNQGYAFVMSELNEPGTGGDANATGTFTGDQIGSWEVSIDALSTWLNGHDLVFLFDNNQQGNLQNNQLWLFAQARIIDQDGNTIYCSEVSSAAGTGCGTYTEIPYVPVVGDFCVDAVSGDSYAPILQGNKLVCKNDKDYYITNNLGTNSAEFAAFDPYMNNNLSNWLGKGYFLSIFTQYYGNLAGYEQLWICSECDINKTPEPGTMALAGLGLLGLAGLRRRKQQA